MNVRIFLPVLFLAVGVISCSDSVTGPGSNGPISVVYSTKRGTPILYSVRADSPSTTPTKIYDGILLTTRPARGTVAWLEELSATESRIMVGSTDGVAAIELAASTDPNRAVSVPVVSPDGRKVCWSTADNRLYIIGTDKSNLVGLSQQAYYGTVPTFSSDGGRIAFYTSQGELAVVNADGTGERIVANNAQDDPIISLGVAWSPSGDRLVYVGALSNGNRDVFSVRSDGTDGKNLTNDASFETNPSFSPDGTQIVYARAGAGIVLMNADGTGSALLTTAGTGVDLFPEWSSDGTRILYVSRATSGTDIGLLKIVDVASKAITLVTVDVFHGFWSR